MALNIENLIHQNRVKWRLISEREIRQYLANDGAVILHEIGDRQERDLILRAYEAGRRDVVLESRHDP